MRHLNYGHLQYFWTVAREGSIVKAADALHITPQTISGQLKLLEETIGQPLFTRAGRRLVLTETGRIVFDYAEEIFSIGAELATVLSKGWRGLIFLCGPRHQALEVAEGFTRRYAPTNVLLLSSRKTGELIPMSPCRARQLVGLEFDAVVLDAFDGFDPDVFGAACGTVRGGGLVLIWVYGYENNEWIVKYVSPIREKITRKIPVSVLHLLSYFLSVPLYLFVRMLPQKKAYLMQLSGFRFSHIHSG